MEADDRTDMLAHAGATRLALIADSYRRLTGAPLVEEAADPAQALWAAPLAIVAHGTEAAPIFFFGNRLALRLFEMPARDFVKLPSAQSAEPVHRDERERLLAEVARNGFINNYSGVRISATRRRFRIEQATVWNLTDAEGRTHGQAAAFAQYIRLEETLPSE